MVGDGAAVQPREVLEAAARSTVETPRGVEAVGDERIDERRAAGAELLRACAVGVGLGPRDELTDGTPRRRRQLLGPLLLRAPGWLLEGPTERHMDAAVAEAPRAARQHGVRPDHAERDHRDAGAERETERSGLERQQLNAVSPRALRIHAEPVTVGEDALDLADGRGAGPVAVHLDPVPGLGPHPAHGPLEALGLGEEPGRVPPHGVDEEFDDVVVEIARVVGHEDKGPAGRDVLEALDRAHPSEDLARPPREREGANCGSSVHYAPARYARRSSMLVRSRPCFAAKPTRSVSRSISPSSPMISTMTPAGRQPASRARSTEASV